MAKIKKIHSILSAYDDSDDKSKAAVKKYLKSKNFTPAEYKAFLSGEYDDSKMFNPADLSALIDKHPHNKPANNDKILDNIEKQLNTSTDDDKYWVKNRLKGALSSLKLSPERVSKLIEASKKPNRGIDISEIHEQPSFNSQHLKQIIDHPKAEVTDAMIKHPAMTKDLFNNLLEEKGYDLSKLPGSVIGHKNFTKDHAQKILDNSEGKVSHFDLDKLLDKVPEDKKRKYIQEKLGMTGGRLADDPEEEERPARYDNRGKFLGRENDDRYEWDNWIPGKHHSSSIAESLANTKHLSPEEIEHIKHHGDFDQKYSLFENPHIDPKHAVEMLSHWDQDHADKGYDLDHLKERIRKEHEDSMYDDYSDDAREEAEEDYPMSDYLKNYSDDELSNMYFDKDKDDWIKENHLNDQDWHGPNPNYTGQQPLDPEETPEEPTIDFANHSNAIDIENHPEYQKRYEEGEKAWQDAMNNADTPEDIYNGYDESISDDVARNVSNLFDSDIDNATSTEHFLPKHVVEAIKAPWKDDKNITPKELQAGIDHPLKMVRDTAIANPNLTPQLISKVLNGDYDDDFKKKALEHNNVTPEHISQIINSDDHDNKLKEKALEHPKALPEHLDQAINSGDEDLQRAALEHPNSNENHAKKLLSAISPEDHIDGRLSQALFDNKFKLSPEDVSVGINHKDPNMQIAAIKHHAATPEHVGKLSNSPDREVKTAVGNVIERRFPPTADQINVKLGTHPLRQLRDYIDANGGTMKKQDFKAANVNTAPIDKLFGPKGTISSQDIQKYIDMAPGDAYNTSHTEWDGGQRHSDEKQKVFQLNYTADQVKAMEDAGVLGTFNKIQDHTFSSGHPVKRNTLGWVRYTGSPEAGFHIDEIQTDLGQSLIKKAAQQAKEAVRNGAITPEQANDALARAKESFPDEHIKKILDITFKGKHPSEVLHEGFKEYMRNKGLANTPVHIWKPESKAPISGQTQETEIKLEHLDDIVDKMKEGESGNDQKALLKWGQKNKVLPGNFKEITPGHLDALKDSYKKFHLEHAAANNFHSPKLEVPLPVHMQEGYGKIPKAMKYQEGTYGELPTQTAEKYKGQPTYKDTIRKSELSDETKYQVALTLKQIQENSQLIESLKNQNPDLYTSLSKLVQSLVEIIKDTGTDPSQLQIADDQQQDQGQQGAAPSGGGDVSQPKDQPLSHGKLTFAPGAIRTYGPGSQRIKNADGSWSSAAGGLQPGSPQDEQSQIPSPQQKQ